MDSSVAALLLKQQGYDVFAMFMQNWHDTEGTLHGDCEWEEDKFVAEMVARKIGIPFYFIDLSNEYRQRVVDYMFDEYSKGRTPNPDVLCNREIKFDAFLKAAQKMGADMVATGHYCRKEPALDAEGNQIVNDGKPVWRILAGSDPNKDQSYFLCQLTEDQLSKALFPIGDICKPEVRRLAAEADLPSAEKKDSQGICFVGKVDLPVFLQQKLKSVEGDVVEVYDAFYEDSQQYCFLRDTMSSILKNRLAGDAEMITDYISDDKAAHSQAGDYEGGCHAESVYSYESIGALSDEDLLRLSRPADIMGDQVVRVLDPQIFFEVIQTGRDVRDKRMFLAEYEKYVEMTVIYDKSYRVLLVLMRDITEEEHQRAQKENVRKQTVEITDQVVAKQMRIVQEIASLLGETTAETKIALTNLKEYLNDE